MQAQIDPHVLHSTQIAADRGWKATFELRSGERVIDVYITASDWDKGAIAVERVGERHLEPRILWLLDISEVQIHF